MASSIVNIKVTDYETNTLVYHKLKYIFYIFWSFVSKYVFLFVLYQDLENYIF